MINKNYQNFKRVITPKIQGTWLLDKLTQSDDLDFLIMFASIAAITGGAGQSDYTAANSYLDAFAAYRNRQGKRTISIDWPIQIPRIAGLPGYDDEAAMRLLTQGAIRWDGKQLRAPMPRFRMNPQDAADVIAYLRSL